MSEARWLNPRLTRLLLTRCQSHHETCREVPVLIERRTINIPFPTNRLAKVALGSLSVDEELSALVKRTFSLVGASNPAADAPADQSESSGRATLSNDEAKTILQVHYRATTPRMLRVAVNGFFESLNVILQVMEELDMDVLHEKGIEGLEGVQGVEQGMTGTAQGVGG